MKDKLTDQQIEWVGDYVMDLLSPEEKADFEQEMIKNPLLQAEVALQHQVMVLVESVEDSRLKEMLQDEQQSIHKKQQHTERNIKVDAPPKKKAYQWWIALGLILLFLLAYLFWNTQQQPKSEKIYANYFQAYENVIVPTVRNSDVPLDVLEAFQKYDAGNYEASLKVFEKLEDNNQPIDYQFYKAMTLMKVGEHKKAIPLFQNLIKNPSSQFQEHARWYLALVYLKENNLNQTKQSLKELLDNQPLIFKDKAEKLLKELD